MRYAILKIDKGKYSYFCLDLITLQLLTAWSYYPRCYIKQHRNTPPTQVTKQSKERVRLLVIPPRLLDFDLRNCKVSTRKGRAEWDQTTTLKHNPSAATRFLISNLPSTPIRPSNPLARPKQGQSLAFFPGLLAGESAVQNKNGSYN